jgi:hypothetical protein
MRALPDDFERRVKPLAGARRGRRLLARLSSAPWAVHDALGITFALIKERRLWLIGAIAYWAFDIATLWACFHAFGSPPTVAVIVMAYFVGALASALPLSGGLGGVEAGMVGAFLAFGTPASLAILAVLSYRLISFWLPTIPGAAAYLQLRRTVGGWRAETNSPSRRRADHPEGDHSQSSSLCYSSCCRSAESALAATAAAHRPQGAAAAAHSWFRER